MYIEAKKAITNKECIQKADQAIGILNKWITVAQGHASDQRQKLALQHAVGRLEVHLTACVLDKKSRAHTKMEDAARHVLEEFAKDVDFDVAPPQEWAPQSERQASQPTSAKSPAVFRKYDDKGQLINPEQVMSGLGFMVGVKVQRGESVAVIESLKGDDVCLLVEDGSMSKKMFVGVLSFIQGEWKRHSEPKPQVEIQWLSDSPRSSVEFASAVLKAKITEAMFEQCRTLQGWETVQILTNPKAVRVTKPWPAKKLQLPCATTRVLLVDASKTTPDQLIIGKFGGFAAVISGFNKVGKEDGEGFQNPFWVTPRSVETTDANMEVHGTCFVKLRFDCWIYLT